MRRLRGAPAVSESLLGTTLSPHACIFTAKTLLIWQHYHESIQVPSGDDAYLAAKETVSSGRLCNTK
jgi:uncharacterized protein (UPF0548 family)